MSTDHHTTPHQCTPSLLVNGYGHAAAVQKPEWIQQHHMHLA